MVRCDGPRLLREFFRSRPGLTQAEAARQLGIVPAAVTGYLKRTQRPRHEVRERMARWSEGAVPLEAWLTAAERRSIARQDAAVIDAPENPDPEQPVKPSAAE